MKRRTRLISRIMTIAFIISLGCTSFASADMLPNPDPMTYTVTYDLQEGTLDSGSITEVVAYNGTYAAMPTALRTGYTFEGWYTEPGGFNMRAEQGGYLVASGDHALYANWTPVTYTVTYDPQEGTLISGSLTEIVAHGGTYNTVPTVSREGYTFGGWWTGANGSGVFVEQGDSLTSSIDHIICASWVPNTYIVYFDSQDGSTVSEDSCVFGEEYGELPTSTREGFELAGWSTSPNGPVNIYSNSVVETPDNHTLYAIWALPSYTVTFDLQEGTLDDGSLTAEVTQSCGTYDLIPAVSRTGYTFDGWWTQENGNGTEIAHGAAVTATADHTLYAKWNPNTYTTTFDLQGGSLTSGSTTKTVTYDSAYGDLPYAIKGGYMPGGYILRGWWTEPNGAGTEVTSATQVTTPSDQTLYAKWRHPSYDVILSTPGTGISSSINCIYDEPYGNLGIPSYPGYTFGGWYTASDGNGTLVTADTIVSSLNPHTLYAKWTPNTYTVTFDTQYGIINAAAQTYTFGSAYSNLPTLTRTNYAFAGWYTASDDSGTLVQTSTTVSTPNDHTLHAKWTPNTYTVTFDPQGGSLSLFDNATITVAYGATYGSLPSASNFPSMFDGWWTGPAGIGTRITSATPVTLTANQTLYAKWTLGVLPYAPPPPPPPSPPITPGLGGHSGYITPPPPPLPPPAPPGNILNLVLRNTQQDGTQRVIPGNFDQNTSQFRFLYDVLPEGAGNSGFMMGYDQTPPSGISQDHWAYQAASRLLSQGILNDEPINPGAAMTRGDLIAMLYRAVAFPLNPTGSPEFSDTTGNDTSINWATERGIINGLPDGTFRPDAEIFRQEAFALIARFLEAYNIELPNTGIGNTPQEFSDAGDIDDWALGDVEMTIQYGLICGVPGGNGPALNPLGQITQGELVALLGRMIDICY